MNIEQKLEIVRQALEKGAVINIGFHVFDTKEEAEKQIVDFGLVPQSNSSQGVYWVKGYGDGYEFEVTAFYKGEEEEPPIFEEEEPLPFADEDFLTDADLEEVMREDMREDYVSSFDLRKGEGL